MNRIVESVGPLLDLAGDRIRFLVPVQPCQQLRPRSPALDHKSGNRRRRHDGAVDDRERFDVPALTTERAGRVGHDAEGAVREPGQGRTAGSSGSATSAAASANLARRINPCILISIASARSWGDSVANPSAARISSSYRSPSPVTASPQASPTNVSVRTRGSAPGRVRSCAAR